MVVVVEIVAVAEIVVEVDVVVGIVAVVEFVVGIAAVEFVVVVVVGIAVETVVVVVEKTLWFCNRDCLFDSLTKKQTKTKREIQPTIGC